ncbi:MAG: tRNA uridine(34) 5-carboxymethylaminomethyl modification radical SAM/GNAT enzyme Elp3 [Deltaproteobacteria bacterium]|nr:tRNA uridine(34) 5-carboxymethylaminomethyl modification radical SAM/GNAT enzyme Elp3 [Deltaproteobacteria bacterium]
MNSPSQHDRRHRFDPERHREQLVAIIREIESLGRIDRAGLDAVLRRHPRGGVGFFSRAELIAGHRHFAAREGFGAERDFADRVQLRPVRSQSGVTPLTVLTKPFPCPGECVFCPSDVRMPKSYLSDEPGAQRAANNRFDPYLQTWNRLDALGSIGHPTEKIELIVLGGTWSFYPESYRIWFSVRCLEAMNDFGAGVDGRAAAVAQTPDFAALGEVVSGNRSERGAYNKIVSGFLGAQQDGALMARGEQASWKRLEEAQRANEEAGCRNVGFSVETRPDAVDEAETQRIRRLGATKVQLGFQSLDDAVLAANKRGHDVATTRRAVGLLRRAGFKIHAHWMPNLLGATPEGDVADFERLFADPGLRPDELKVYPCSLIESAELMRFFEAGEWRPYEYDELLAVLTAALERTPRYCRITRMIRDISSDDIVEGNKLTNFREIAQRALEERGGGCEDVRSREIRGRRFAQDQLCLRETRYSSDEGEECFLEFVTPDDEIVAFLRLSLPGSRAFLDEIAGSALVREVHVYGAALGLGARSSEKAQHRGLGTRLLDEAAQRARHAGFRDLAVISAVGTRGYYRKLGFSYGMLYQHRSLVR